MSEMDAWYIVKRESGECVIVSSSQLNDSSGQSANSSDGQWGPYTSRDEAIARRVGLIRAGKCRPV